MLSAPQTPRSTGGADVGGSRGRRVVAADRLTVLRWSLAAGALYDVSFAVLMLAAPELPARLLALPLPPRPAGAFYLWILAVLLCMLASLYLVAAGDPRRHTAIVTVAALGRLAGALAFLVAAARQPGLAGLYPLAAADGAFGLVHAVCGWPLRS
jgi:hypothetical protein